MKSYLIIGLGRFGTAIAKELYRLRQEVMVIDVDKEEIQKISPFVTYAATGDAREEGVLQSVGVNNFDCVIVAVGSSVESSVMATVLLKELGAKYIIAKAQNQLHYKILEKVGADRVIFPEMDMGKKLAQRLVSDNVLDYIELSPDYSIAEIETPKAWTGKTLAEIGVRAKYSVSVIAMRKTDDRKKLLLSPGADNRLEAGQILVMLGENKKIRELAKV
jgi:trk system potassium uptake protein TrkA